jgi:hypothetical protein
VPQNVETVQLRGHGGRGGGGWGGREWDGGFGGIGLGLAAGAIVGGALAAPYYGGGYGYYGDGYGRYYAPAYYGGYAPSYYGYEGGYYGGFWPGYRPTSCIAPTGAAGNTCAGDCPPSDDERAQNPAGNRAGLKGPAEPSQLGSPKNSHGCSSASCRATQIGKFQFTFLS